MSTGVRKLVLCHLQSRRCRHIHHLSPFDRFGRHLRQVGLTMLTLGEVRQTDHFIGGHTHLQRLTWVTWLSSWFLSTARAQTSGFALSGKAVRGRRPRTLVAVFGTLLLQLLDL